MSATKLLLLRQAGDVPDDRTHDAMTSALSEFVRESPGTDFCIVAAEADGDGYHFDVEEA